MDDFQIFCPTVRHAFIFDNFRLFQFMMKQVPQIFHIFNNVSKGLSFGKIVNFIRVIYKL